jgi:hypothetical protein
VATDATASVAKRGQTRQPETCAEGSEDDLRAATKNAAEEATTAAS